MSIIQQLYTIYGTMLLLCLFSYMTTCLETILTTQVYPWYSIYFSRYARMATRPNVLLYQNVWEYSLSSCNNENYCQHGDNILILLGKVIVLVTNAQMSYHASYWTQWSFYLIKLLIHFFTHFINLFDIICTTFSIFLKEYGCRFS